MTETNETFTQGEWVYVSDESVSHALEKKSKEMYLLTYPWNKESKYICINDGNENDYLNNKNYSIVEWKYIAKIPQEKTHKFKTTEWVEVEISEEELKKLWFTF